MTDTSSSTPRPASADRIAGILAKATTASEAVRGIVHDTLGRDAIPAAGSPGLYRILDQLEDLVVGLDQALLQVAGSLLNSLAVYDLREDNPDTDPVVSISQACDQLDDAATYLFRAGRHIAAARAAIAGQSYANRPSPTTSEAAR